MNYLFKKILRLIIIIILTSFATATHASQTTPLNIGVILDLSGEAAEMGQKATNGIKVAQDLLPKESVNIFYEDTAGQSAKNAITAYLRLIQKHKIDIIIGPFGPDQTQALSPVAQKNNHLLFAMSMCVDDFKKLPNVICTYPSTADQLSIFPKLLTKIDSKKIALVLEDSVFAYSTIPIVESQAKEGNFTIVSKDFFPPESLDYNSLVLKAVKSNPDTIFISHGATAKALSFVRALRERNYQGNLVAFIDIDEKYLNDFGEIIDGVYLPGFTSTIYGQQFVDGYKRLFNEEPKMIYSAQTFDIVNGLVTSFQKFSSENKETTNSLNKFLLDNLASVIKTETALIGYKFRSDRTATCPIESWQIKNKQFITFLTEKEEE